MKIKNYKGRILGLLIIAFITTNAFLIYFDEDHDTIDRKSYIDQWSKSITYDLFEILDSEGVFASQESKRVYFDHEVGAFQQFSVDEGQEVSQGDDLYTYEVIDYEQQEAQLEGEITRLEEEIEAVEDQIDEMEDYDIPEPENEDSLTSDSDDRPSYVETEFQKKAKIAEQEAELAKKEAMLEMVEDQLDQLQEEGQKITVTSSFDGTVTHLSDNLEAPILTIESTNLQIEGKFDEEERKLVEEEMKARVYIPDIKLELTGTLSSIRTFPEDVKVHRSSSYPYEITLEDMDDRILPGYHADVDIITDEARGVVTVLEDLLLTEKNLFVWVMNNEGQLERRTVETGIEENGLIEITDGLKEGEWLAYKPKDEFRSEATFFTPVKLRDLQVRQILEMDKDTMITYGLLGLAAR